MAKKIDYKKLKDREKKEFDLARVRVFIDLNPRPVITVDHRGSIIDINASARKLFPDLEKKGLKHAYFKGLTKIIRNLQKENNPKIPLIREIKLSDDAWFRQIFYYVPEYDVVHIYASDISDWKRTNDELIEREKRYRTLFEKMNYGYGLQDIIFDKNGKPIDYRFVDVNPAFEKLSGLKKETIIGKTISQLQGLEASTPDKNRKLYDKVAITGKPLYLETYSKPTKKYFKAYAYKPSENQISLIFRDITKEKTEEEDKNNFIAIMSHELRNPLTPILASAQYIKSILAQDSPVKEPAEIIEKEAKIMANILDDTLTIFKINYNKLTLKKQKFNLCSAVENSILSSMPFIKMKQQTISGGYSQNPVTINGDQTKVEQIFTNLINNASKYTNFKGNIKVSCFVKNNMAIVQVKDNGMGMDKEKIKKIFNLFNEESQSFMGIGGLGIGLNIVKKLVALHNGVITVMSEGKNKGSEFTVSFPLVKNRDKTIDILEKKEEIIPGKHRVLIVEDNQDIRTIITKILSNQGYNVESTYSGKEAIKILKTFKPDTALIDIGLPDINGYQVARAIRKNTKEKIKLIALTGYGQNKDKNLAKDAGFDYHVTKPVDIDQLTKLIRSK